MVTFANHFYSKYYCGNRTTVSIGNVLPLCGIPEAAIICNVEHHVDDRVTFARASRDYAIMTSRNPNNDTSMRMLPTKVWPPWLVDVFDISSNLMNWLT